MDVVGDLISLTEEFYLKIHHAGDDCALWLRERAILAQIKESVNRIKNFLWRSCHMRCEPVDSAVEAVHYPVESSRPLGTPGVSPVVLYLIFDAPILLLPYLNLPKLCNRTRH